MKHFYTKIRVLLIAVLFVGTFLRGHTGNAQTTLSAGDILFTSYDSTPLSGSGGDSFSFVLLSPISAGTQISFSDRGYQGPGAWQSAGSTEGSITWTSANAVNIGTEINIVGLTAFTYNPTTSVATANGTVVVTEGTANPAVGLNLSNVGDQIIAFQGGGGIISAAGATMIAGINYLNYNSNTTTAGWNVGAPNSPNASLMPPGLTGGVSAFYTGPANGSTTTLAQSGKFNCTGVPTTTAANIRAAVMNQANWTLTVASQGVRSGCLFVGSPAISITTPPASTSVCAGAGNSATFSVTAVNATGYQWQMNDGAGYINVTNGGMFSGTTTSTLTITGATTNMDGYLFRVVTSRSGSTSVTTTSATLTVNPALAITTQPSNSAICAGSDTTFSTAASNATGYQWQVNTGSGFTDITNGGVYSGATSVTLSVNGATASMNGYQYRVLATGNCPTATSNAVSLTINSAPSFTLQPSNSTICAGANTAFAVTGGNTTSYQWQLNTGSGFTNISDGGVYSGATTATLTVTGTTADMNGYQYRNVATGNCTPNATSNTVSLTINSAPAITSQPANSTVCAGSNTSFSATATGATGYQWQVNQGAGYVNVSNNSFYSGATSATLTITGPTAGMNGYMYRLIISGNCTPQATSNGVTLTISNISLTPEQNNVSCNGLNDGTLGVTASGGVGSYTYSWNTTPVQTTSSINNLAPGTYTVTVTDSNSCTATQSFTITEPDILVASQGTINNPSCFEENNGTATVNVTGGTGGRTYSWSPSGGTAATASGLTAGTYTVTVTDAKGCTATQSFTLTEPTAITTSVSAQTNVSCDNGSNASATVSATGGTGTLYYSWSPFGGTDSTASGLSAGTYTVTVTDTNNCTATQTVEITQPTDITPSVAAQTNVACRNGNNGSATVSVSGGTPGYTYSWAPSGGTAATATGLYAGTYTVTITDAKGCTATQSVTITQPATMLVASTSRTDATCTAGGQIAVYPSGGGSSYSYLWSNGATTQTITNLAAGPYSVVITDSNSCSITKNFTVSTTNTLTATTSQTDILCNGTATGSATINVSGNSGALTYVWSPSVSTTATASALTAGTYTVTASLAGGCSITRSFTITQPIALVASIGAQTNLPCNGATTGSATVNVTGGTGNYTYSWAPSGGTAATASGLTAGTYTVTVTDANLCTATQSFTITQPTAITINPSHTNVSCNGLNNGSATVTVTGGTGAYTYSWVPSGGTAATASGLAPGAYTVTVKDANNCTATQSFTITQPSALVASIGAQTNLLCNGAATGSATVNVTGGTGAYTYSWSPSGGTAATASGLTAGTYTVTVTDANLCTATQSFTITQPTAITINPSHSNVSCNGLNNGSATVTVTGGTGAYTYSWVPSGGTAATATGLAPGAYTVTVKDANNCTATQSFTITQPSALVASIGAQTNLLCNGATTGSATVNVTGGTGAYTYSWAPSGGTAATASGLTAGTYIVTVTDANNCTTTQSFTITQPTAITINPSHSNVSCNGLNNGSATVTVTGGTGAYTYAWVPSGGTAATASGLSPGAYTVTVKDANNCTATQSFTITQPAPLVATAGPKTNVLCNGATTGSATVNVTGGMGNYTYSWAPSGGTAATASGLTAGTYTVTVTDANNCTTTQSFTITQPTAIVITPSHINVSCNGLNNGSATVTVTGGTGAYTYAWVPSGGTAATASGLAPGAYTVTVKDANNCTVTQSFTITQPAPLVATAGVQTNLVCNGASTGSATVNVTGGMGDYTYSWAPSGGTAATASGLTEGTYTVTVTDANNCTATQSFTITAPTAITATSIQTNILCNGQNNGAATITATGGSGNYTYLWAPSGGTSASATGLTAGTYTVTITDSAGCTGTKEIVITQPDVLIANSTTTNINCFGTSTGTATISVLGGTAPFEYVWTPNVSTTATATELAVGNYSVVVTDANGCTTSKSFAITQKTELIVTPTQTNVSCNGGSNGSASVTVTGGSPEYFYVWAPTGGTGPSATGLTAGTYTLTITDMAGCVTIESFDITQPDVLAVDVNQTNILCGGTDTGEIALTVTGGTEEYTYEWTPNVSTGATASNLIAGNYSVTITDANGCSILRNFSLTQPEVLTSIVTKTDAICNGATGSAAVIAGGGVGPYTYEWLPSGGTAAEATDLLAGNYTVTITDASGCTKVENVTITQPQGVNITTQPQSADITVNNSATFTTAAGNVTGYQWQVSENGENWTDVTDGGTNPVYSGATTNSLTLTNVPVSYNGYQYRVAFLQAGDCFTLSNAATLNVTNVLVAVNDDFSTNTILEGTGGIAGDVTTNDLYNNEPVEDADVIISVVNTGGLAGVTIDEDGNINVPASTPDGTYFVIYRICDAINNHNCSDATVTIVVSPVVGLDDFSKLDISIYPNPASTEVFVKVPDFSSHNNLKASLYDLNGRLVRDGKITTENFSMDVTGLESAIYILNVTSDAGVITKRIAVTKKF